MKLSYLFAAAAAVCSMSLAGCSDNNDAPAPFDDLEQSLFMSKLSEGQESATYHLESFSFYQMSNGNNDGWVEQDFNDWVGLSVPAPADITIHNGCTWQPLVMFNVATGPSALYMPLYAYRLQTGFDKEFYVAAPIDYDADTKTMKIDKYTYEVESVSEDVLKIIHISEFWGGIDGKGGQDKFNITFKRKELSLPDLDKIVFYGSELEAKLAIIEMLRAQFGDEFNVNKYLTGQVILDDPMVNLNEIEAGLRAGTIY